MSESSGSLQNCFSWWFHGPGPKCFSTTEQRFVFSSTLHQNQFHELCEHICKPPLSASMGSEILTDYSEKEILSPIWTGKATHPWSVNTTSVEWNRHSIVHEMNFFLKWNIGNLEFLNTYFRSMQTDGGLKIEQCINNLTEKRMYLSWKITVSKNNGIVRTTQCQLKPKKKSPLCCSTNSDIFSEY